MKRKVFFIVTLCVTFFTSCSNDESVTPESGQQQTAKIELTLTGANAGTRASGGTAPSENTDEDGNPIGEQKVNNIVVGVFDSYGNTLIIKSVTNPDVSKSASIEVPLVKGTMNGCTAVAVANVPASVVATLNNVKIKSSFIGTIIGLSSSTASSDGEVQVSTNLPMSGNVADNANAQTFTLSPGNTTSGLSVSLVRMVSRITLTGISTNFTGTAYSGATFKLQRVFLRDAIDGTKVTPSTIISEEMSGSYIKGGGTWDNTEKKWTSDINNYLFNVQTAGSEPAIGSSSPIPGTVPYYWFYAFANDGSASPTAFVIQGLFDSDGDGETAAPETVFYPVIVNKTQSGTTYNGDNTGTSTGSISRNQLYNLSVTIRTKGAALPTDNIAPAALSINISVTPWPTAIEQSVAFN